jgi:hypothetical protein
VRQTTIAALTALRAPSDLPATRLRLERRVYRVTARVTLVRHEADDDFHLVLRQHRPSHDRGDAAAGLYHGGNEAATQADGAGPACGAALPAGERDRRRVL